VQSPIIAAMNFDALIEEIDAEIMRLEKARALLTEHTAPLKRGLPHTKRRTMSAEGRARIAAAQKKRWAVKEWKIDEMAGEGPPVRNPISSLDNGSPS
jgi:hypothetical protein